MVRVSIAEDIWGGWSGGKESGSGLVNGGVGWDVKAQSLEMESFGRMVGVG